MLIGHRPIAGVIVALLAAAAMALLQVSVTTTHAPLAFEGVQLHDTAEAGDGQADRHGHGHHHHHDHDHEDDGAGQHRHNPADHAHIVPHLLDIAEAEANEDHEEWSAHHSALPLRAVAFRIEHPPRSA